MSKSLKEASRRVDQTTALIDISTAKIESILSKNGCAAKLKKKLKGKKNK
jgi:hypothetical protein